MGWNEAKKSVAKNKSGDFYNLEEGDNKLRLLEAPVEVASHYFEDAPQGEKNKTCTLDENGRGCRHCLYSERRRVQYMANCILRDTKNPENDKCVLVKFGTQVMEKLIGLREDADYGFETDIPPYDVNVKKIVKGKKPTDVAYDVLPLPTKVLSERDNEMLNGMKPAAGVVAKMLQKARDEQGEMGEALAPAGKPLEEEIKVEDVPL